MLVVKFQQENKPAVTVVKVSFENVFNHTLIQDDYAFENVFNHTRIPDDYAFEMFLTIVGFRMIMPFSRNGIHDSGYY